MRTPRIFHPQPLDEYSVVELESGAARHVVKVLRLGVGATLTLFDGSGGEYPASIESVAKRSVMVRLSARINVDVESPLHITLVQGVSKGERMDFTIQKAVELGVSRIVPLNTERSVVNLKGERLEKKLAHWQGVIVSACEQCGRNTLPELLPMQTLQGWLSSPSEGLRLLLDHRSSDSAGSLAAAQVLTLLIGPEGGLSERERAAATEKGYRGIRLGPRVLRTETAALSALAVLQSRFGDLR